MLRQGCSVHLSRVGELLDVLVSARAETQVHLVGSGSGAARQLVLEPRSRVLVQGPQRGPRPLGRAAVEDAVGHVGHGLEDVSGDGVTNQRCDDVREDGVRHVVVQGPQTLARDVGSGNRERRDSSCATQLDQP
eukprot:CAMPEP_0175614776 /NCGR_PEP_ID=MMETSP0096-20121207/65029_1 /TAXON_ID=311494 /ORGANISM="Alexandrium monilatum, Strain CCMP3105" /LENGTH=133 /DNA_ID=CAMNT_0016919895 /DNA_START=130 /DNA_END=527 /DNA_ORIENTATION=-